MSHIRNRVESHIILNVERIDFNERLHYGEFESSASENKLHGIVTEGFERLKGLNHVNVCKYTNMIRIDGNSYLFVSEGYSLTLNRIFTSTSEQFLKMNFANIVNQIICGLQYLHSSGFSHGRLTLDCISISDEGLVKIGGYANNYVNSIVNYMYSKMEKDNDEDEGRAGGNQLRRNYIMNGFGIDDKNEFIECLKNSNYLYNLMLYMPPEVVFCNEKSVKSSLFWFNVDVWSLGICILLITSYIIWENEFKLHAQNTHSQDKDCKVGSGFQRLKKLFNLPVGENAMVVEPWLFVLYLLVLINKMENNNGQLSTIGLNINKIVTAQFKFLSDENESESIKLIGKLFGKVKGEVIKCQNNNTHNGNSVHEQLVVPTVLNEDAQSDLEKVISSEEAISILVELLTGEDVLNNLIKLKDKSDSSSVQQKKYVGNLNYLLSIANDCLIIENGQRPSAVDLCSRHSILKLSQNNAYNLCDRENDQDREDKERQEREEEFNYSWFTYKEKYEYATQVDSFSQRYTVESFKESQTIFSESKFFLNYVGLENVLYYWTLLGNEVNNIVPFHIIKKVDSEEGSGKRKLSYRTLEYFKRYRVGKIFLGELITHVKLANLFPMILEHQLRPSCVYARHQCFIYQLLRIRRFKRLLTNAVENRRQIYVEAMIDIPPLLRSQIWCNLLEVIYRPATKGCPLTTGYDFSPVPPELEQNLNFYNNDLLYSTTNLKKLLSSVEDLKMKIIHQQLPSSIYSFAIPLILLYHDSSVYNTMLDRIFRKYLKDFYAPTGSFVNNYLSEFSTILNFFDPEISYHLRSIGAYADSYALPWFMSLFAENTTLDQLYMIWDSVLVQPKQYIKFLAVMIIHNIRERLLEMTDARIAISFISCVVDSLNVPMLMYLTTHMYTTWFEVLSSKASPQKSSPLNEWLDQNGNCGTVNEVKTDTEGFNLERNTFIFLSDEYPFERCFRISIETFSNVFKDCIIIDMRSVESYNMGHIPNSLHINKLLSSLSDTDKRTAPISIPIFNEKNAFATNLDFKANSAHNQSIGILNGLRNNTRKPWLQVTTAESSKIVLVAGDGYDEENEMGHLRKLVFEYKLQHVCYYRINTEEWPKVLTLSKI
ncbi:hypothetical protein MACJ_000659 [Theileria orientalis]|uniref:TBC domain-containing protein kinase-like protein n=1 Tax=Theileria orientalis TaxID=68886 RepID=A0A976M4E5_THEOR|nr:hypothetical protein MACJ_000659 [Theileria orientalis]